MIRDVVIWSIRAILLVLVQVLLLDDIQVGGILNPYIYPLFILLLPFNTRPWVLMFIAFAMGLTVDSFSDSYGFHAAVLVAVAFFRPFILNFFAPREGYDTEDTLGIPMGWRWNISYMTAGILVHHILYFLIEVNSLASPFYVFKKIFGSLFFSLLIIFIIQILFWNNSRRRSV